MNRRNGSYTSYRSEEITNFDVQGANYDLRKCWELNISEQFPIASTELKNRKAIAKVDSPHSGFYIESFMSNGKLNGKADIYSDMNILVASLEFVNGIANGPCTLYDEMGRLFFKGYLQNGMRQWRGREYDCEGNEVFDGFFEKGKKLNIFKIDRTKKYWKEVDNSNIVQCICERDEHGMKKGICYFYNNGKISRISEWKNGEEIRLIKEFKDTEMIEYDDTQSKVKYIGEYLDSFELNYPREGYGIEYDINTRSIVYQGYFFDNQRHGRGKSLYKGRIQYDGIWNNGTKKWWYYMRNIFKSIIFLWLFFFVFCKVSLLYKFLIILYYWIKIELFFLPQYGFKQLVVQGTQSLDQFDVGVSDLEVVSVSCNNVNQIEVHNMIQLKSIDIGDECFQRMISFQLDGKRSVNNRSLKIDWLMDQCYRNFILLFSLYYYNYYIYSNYMTVIDTIVVVPIIFLFCFNILDYSNLKAFKIDGLTRLKRIKVGRYSYVLQSKWGMFQSQESWEVLNTLIKRVGDTKSFHIVNCCNLESIEIGEYSFSDYSGNFELKNLPNLQTIKIGTIGRESYNFCCSSFEIRGMYSILYSNK